MFQSICFTHVNITVYPFVSFLLFNRKLDRDGGVNPNIADEYVALLFLSLISSLFVSSALYVGLYLTVHRKIGTCSEKAFVGK